MTWPQGDRSYFRLSLGCDRAGIGKELVPDDFGDRPARIRHQGDAVGGITSPIGSGKQP